MEDYEDDYNVLLNGIKEIHRLVTKEKITLGDLNTISNITTSCIVAVEEGLSIDPADFEDLDEDE